MSPLDKHESGSSIAQALDRPFRSPSMAAYNLESIFPPPEAELTRWLSNALSRAFPICPFVNRVFVEYNVERWHSEGHSDAIEPEELGLMYALLALGQRFDSSLALPGGDGIKTGAIRG